MEDLNLSNKGGRGKVEDVPKYFIHSMKQLFRFPYLAVPSLISSSLLTGIIWTLIFSLILLSLPIIPRIIPIINKFSEYGYYASDSEVYQLVNELEGFLTDIGIVFVMIIILGVILTILYIILNAYINAGRIGYIWKGITRDINLNNFFVYGRRYLLRVLLLWIIKFFIFLTYSIIFFAILAFFFVLLFITTYNDLDAGTIALNAFIFILILILSLILYFIFWIMISILLFFSDILIVVKDSKVIESIENSIRLVCRNIWCVALFYLVSICIWIVFYLIFAPIEFIISLSGYNLSSLSTLISTLLLIPIIEIARMNLFLSLINEQIMIPEIESIRIKNLIIRCLSFVKESPRILSNFVCNDFRYILACSIIALFGFYIGYNVGSPFSVFSDTISDLIYQRDGGILGTPYTSLPFIDFFEYLFNNTLVCLYLFISGIFLGIIPLIGIFNNSVLISIMFGILPLNISIASIIPHGIIEFSALLISSSAGLKFGLHLIRRNSNINEVFNETLRVCLSVLILIIIAAFIEAFITPIITYIAMG
ncbi:MAG: hypothetical protein DRO94_00115 [Candidatus Altiarchaeales archaeon]|nr:MAG: hypothetical protein DRO94_00115 [Candidatus Altiarchaeales archaeon]